MENLLITDPELRFDSTAIVIDAIAAMAENLKVIENLLPTEEEVHTLLQTYATLKELKNKYSQ